MPTNQEANLDEIPQVTADTTLRELEKLSEKLGWSISLQISKHEAWLKEAPKSFVATVGHSVVGCGPTVAQAINRALRNMFELVRSRL